jgi:hypothetical protein
LKPVQVEYTLRQAEGDTAVADVYRDFGRSAAGCNNAAAQGESAKLKRHSMRGVASLRHDSFEAGTC